MEAKFECLYCGYKWQGFHATWKTLQCNKCTDKRIKIKEVEEGSTDIFGYELEQAQLLRNQGSSSNC